MKSKICLVISSNLKHATLISIYTRILDENNIPYDLIYFDRYGIDENTNAENVYKYTQKMDKSSNMISKLPTFIKFKFFAQNMLKKNDYRVIIVWNTLTAILLSSYLLKSKKNYILNIRDYYFEKNPIVFKLHEHLIKKSLFTTISSLGFLNFLPDNDYVFVNSANENIIEKKVKPNINKDTKINIGFIGNVRFFDELKKIMNIFKNDSRFMLSFCGTNSEILEEYARKNDINNCAFIGQFEPDETSEILESFDIINNLFGNESESVNYLTSIRLYYSSFFKIPILVNNNTFMSTLVNEYGLGKSLNIDEPNIKEKIYNWYKNINVETFSKNCDVFNQKVLQDNQKFKKKYLKVLNNYITNES